MTNPLDLEYLEATELRRQLGLLSEDELAALAEVDVGTVRNWRAQRYGPPFVKIGRRPLYRVEAFQKWIREREEETQP